MLIENAFYWHRIGMEYVFNEIEKQEPEEDENQIRNRQNIFDYMLREEEMSIVKPPKYVEDIIISDFISKGNKCAITLGELNKENAALTSCYHVFDKNAVSEWVIQNKTCPTCRKECVVWGIATRN